MEPMSDSGNGPRASSVYRVGLAAASPSWELASTLPEGFTDADYRTTLYSHPSRAELYVAGQAAGALAQSHTTLLKSTDLGASWTEHRPPFDAITNRAQPTERGVVFPGFHPTIEGERF